MNSTEYNAINSYQHFFPILQKLSNCSPIGDVVHEGCKRLHGVGAHVLELDDQLLSELVIDDGYLQRRRLVGEEVAIVSALKMQFQICNANKRN